MHANTIVKKVFIFGASVLIGLWTLTGVAAAAPAQKADGGSGAAAGPHAGRSSHVKECSPSHHSDSGRGANTDGSENPYSNTCPEEHAPGNGVGDGAATGKPCAGCVGNADDKNPPGQAPGGSDHNAGYECDRNEGVGKENPAHTGCADGETGDVAGGDVTPPLTAAGSDPPPSNTAVLSATVDSTVDSSSVDVLAPAVSGTAGAAVAGVVISEGVVPEAAVADPGKPSVANASTSGRPAEVLGVRYERSAPSTLARTGVDLVAFAGAGVLLCLGGAGLLSVRSRRDTVSVAARLAGYGIAA
jgi:hypothetical protein